MSLFWSDGAIRTSEAVTVSQRNRGLTLGDGLFETILVVNYVPLWLDEHLARLRVACGVLGIDYPAAELEKAIISLVNEGGEAVHSLRINLSRGVTKRGLAGDGAQTDLCIALDPFDKRLIGKPTTLATSSIKRSATSFASTHKTLSYVDAIVAAREASSKRCDDALMLNTDGKLASSSIANIFICKGKTLYTPSLDQGILPGIMRQVLINNAAEIGYGVTECPLSPDDVFESDLVFLTNSLRIVRPVTHLDGRSFAKSDCSAFLDLLCNLAAKKCVIDPRIH